MSDFNRRIHRERMLREMQLPSKIPANHAGTYHMIPVFSDCAIKEPWGRITLVVKRSIPLAPRPGRSKPPKSSTHRVFVKCPCNRLVPAGRYHQHASACPKPYATNEMALFVRIDGLVKAGREWPEIERRLGMQNARELYERLK